MTSCGQKWTSNYSNFLIVCLKNFSADNFRQEQLEIPLITSTTSINSAPPRFIFRYPSEIVDWSVAIASVLITIAMRCFAYRCLHRVYRIISPILSYCSFRWDKGTAAIGWNHRRNVDSRIRVESAEPSDRGWYKFMQYLNSIENWESWVEVTILLEISRFSGLMVFCCLLNKSHNAVRRKCHLFLGCICESCPMGWSAGK